MGFSPVSTLASHRDVIVARPEARWSTHRAASNKSRRRCVAFLGLSKGGANRRQFDQKMIIKMVKQE